MGFFTDSDKKEENIGFKKLFLSILLIIIQNLDQGFFQNPGQSVAENNFFISRQGSSLSKVCRTDPKDNKFMICNIKEKKLRNENGQVKIINYLKIPQFFQIKGQICYRRTRRKGTSFISWNFQFVWFFK